MRKAACFLLVAATACAPTEVVDPPFDTGTVESCVAVHKDFGIIDIAPAIVSPDGIDELVVKTCAGCGENKVSGKFNGLPLSGIQSTDRNTYRFRTLPVKLEGGAPRVVKIELTCSSPPDTAFVYGLATAEAAIKVDRTVGPALTIVAHDPVGDEVPTTTSIRIRLNRPVDFARTQSAIGLEGVTGTTALGPGEFEVTFTPDAPLQPATTYTAFVKSSLESQEAHLPLTPTIAPEGVPLDPAADRWTFRTHD